MNYLRQAPEQLVFELSTTVHLPITGVFISLLAKTDYKNSFSFLFGPSDREGKIAISWEEIVKRANETAQFWIMDYGSFEKTFIGELEVGFADEGRLKRALKAYSDYNGAFSFPPGYEVNVRRAMQIARELVETQIRCNHRFVPTTACIRITLIEPLTSSSPPCRAE